MADKDDLMELPSPFINYFGRDVFLVWGPSMSSLCPRSEVSISVASRLPRVSSLLALITHQVAVRRYPGGWAWKNSHAFAIPRNCFSYAPSSLHVLLSYEYCMAFCSSRPANALRDRKSVGQGKRGNV